MWKNLFGVAAIITAMGFFIRSFQPAYAQLGPTVSLGSNPVKHIYSTCSGGGNTMYTNNTSSDFIIMDFIPQGGQYTLTVNGSTALASGFNGPTTLGAGIKLEAGESIQCQNNYGYPLTIAGYYAHP